MHPTSEELFKTRAVPHLFSGMCVLEIGPNSIPSFYFKFLQAAGVEVNWYWADTFRTEKDHRRVSMPSLYKIDALDEHFDAVIHGQVLEHIEKIWRWLPETARVLKMGGRMIVLMPAAYEYHACPVDCWRAYPAGLSALFEDSGIRVDLAEWFLVDPENKNGQADTIAIGTKIGPPLISFNT